MQDLSMDIIRRLDLSEVPIEAILPLGKSGFAVDGKKRLIGLKVGLQRADDRDLDFLFNMLTSTIYLQRLVLYLNHPKFDFPTSVLKQNNLKFIWLAGKCRTIPADIANLNLPIFAGEEELRRSNLGKVQELYDIYREKITDTSVEVREPASVLSRTVDADTDLSTEQENTLAELISKNPKFRSASASITGVYLSTESETPPAEIVQKGADALRLYFASFGTDAGRPLNEVKVIFVGDGGAGKTSLVKRLVGDHFRADEQQTHGINIRQWTAPPDHEPIRVNLWDFGGQEIMHSTHQFFLSKRSVYVVLLDGRKEEDAEYWLQHVKVFGGDSPVLVAINKIDENPSFDVNRRFITEKYNNIVGYYRLSCKNNIGIEDFRTAVEGAIQKAPMHETRWPRSWFQVKQQLENYAADKPYISLGGYTELCEKEGINDPESQEVLVDFLHDLGIVVHFKDMNLLDTHVLNPRWVTEGVYRIINSKILAAKKGVLDVADLADILAAGASSEFTYPKDKYSYLIELMLKFELCYKMDGNQFLFPDLLDRQEPDYSFDKNVSPIRFIFEYEYLPKSVIARFIVRFSKDIYRGMCWRTGTILRRTSSATAMVKADDAAKRIYIEVVGAGGRDFFTSIRQAFAEIHASFEALSVSELVPLPDAPQVTVDYKELLGHERSGRAEMFVGRLQRDYDVRELLNGLVDEGRRRWEATSAALDQPYSQSFERGAAMTHDKEPITGPQPWEKVVMYCAAGALLALMIYLVVNNKKIEDPNLVVIIRVLLSFCTACLGAAIPGFLHIAVNTKGMAIRATGALALFVITFLMTPTVMPAQGNASRPQATAQPGNAN